MSSLARVKRLARVIGVLGGVIALVWAMRDRFISVATSREPQPPRFREVGATQPVAIIDGIGPVYEERLNKAGIRDVASLSKASPDSVAEAAGVSASRARDWITQAGNRTGE
jgi:predicted flap endonuclease-1-like 5' DNA nuclease